MYKQNKFRVWLRPILKVGCAFSYSLCTCVAAQNSTDLNLSQSPLQAQGVTKPNLMIVLDSSGSMAWSVDSDSYPSSGESSRLDVVKTAANNLLDTIPDESMRVGYATFDGDSGAKIRDNIGLLTTAQRQGIQNSISNTSSGDSTPLAEVMMDIGRYFTYGYGSNERLTLHPGDSYDQTEDSTQSVANIFTRQPAFARDLSAPSSPVVENYCQSNFMIMLTDGEPTLDRSISNHLKDYAVACTEANCSDKEVRVRIGNNYWDSSLYLPDVAAALHDMDLRPDLSESVTEPTKNNVTSYFIGFASSNLSNNSLLTDAARYGGGQYLYAENAASLSSAFNQAIGAISNQVGNQSSVSFNSTKLDAGSVVYFAQFDTGDNSGSLYAYELDPETGRLKDNGEQWEASKKLALKSSGSRQIITSRNGSGVPFQVSDLQMVPQQYEVTVNLTGGSSNQDVTLTVGSDSSTTTTRKYKSGSVTVTTSDTASPIVVSCSGCDSANYVIVNSVGIDGSSDPTRAYLGYSGTSRSYSSISDQGLTELTAQRLDLRTNTSTDSADDLWEDRLGYLRGSTTNDGTGNFRRRGTFTSGDAANRSKLLGDIVHSTPTYVGAPEQNWPDSFSPADDSYAQFAIDYSHRNPMVYLGANDGMLHGFNAETGEEVFSYVPSLIANTDRYQGLHAYTSEDYRHRYYVDLTPAVSDVYINDDWHTVLIGGLRGGGKGYFALDVTNNRGTYDADGNLILGADKLAAAESHASEIVMWEFDGGNDTDRNNLGYSFAVPQIARLNNGRWAAIFGNGYNSENGTAGLFLVYIDAGADGWQAGDWKFIPTGVGALDSGRKNGLSTPRLIDLNDDRIVDRVYAGDLMGNMWAFDLCDKQDDGSCSASDANWGVAHSAAGEAAPLFSVGNGESQHAITVQPLVARNIEVPTGTSPNVLVMFGTGQYLNTNDLEAEGSEPGAFYTVWDKGVANLGQSNLVARNLVSADGGPRSVSDDSDDAIDWDTYYGWYMPLSDASGDYAAERVISGAALRSNTLLFNTVIPNQQPCASSGTGWLMSLDFRTGLPEVGLDRPVVDFNNDGSIDGDDAGYVGKRFVRSCDPGSDCSEDSPAGGDMGTPGESGYIGTTRCTPGSAGGLDCEVFNPKKGEREGRLSWEEFSPE